MPDIPPRSTSSRISSGSDWAAGPVTRLGLPAPTDPPPAPVPGRPDDRDRRRLWWFGGAAGALLVVGLVAVLVFTSSGDRGPFGDRPDAAADVRPPLARLCPSQGAAPAAPPATAPARPTGTAPPTAGPGQPLAGQRTVDTEAGISYPAYGAPWQPWPTVWNAGTLQVPYKVGQHFVTEQAYNGFSDYHASILSAAVPAADNDALTFDLACVGRQVAADVRAEYYPRPNRSELLRDERTDLGGLPAWVTVFRLHFSQPGLRATDELAAVACIDVGRSTAAILYISIPGTHRHLDWVVDHALASVRPA